MKYEISLLRYLIPGVYLSPRIRDDALRRKHKEAHARIHFITRFESFHSSPRSITHAKSWNNQLSKRLANLLPPFGPAVAEAAGTAVKAIPVTAGDSLRTRQ